MRSSSRSQKAAPCGVVLDALYTGAAEAGMYKAKLLFASGLFAAIYQILISDGWMKLIQFHSAAHPTNGPASRSRGSSRTGSMNITMPPPRGCSSGRRTFSAPTSALLGLRLTLDVSMWGVGGLMGIVVANSCLIGTLPQLRGVGADHDPARRHREPCRRERHRDPRSAAARS